MTSKVLITGGAGFVGAKLVEKQLLLGNEVHVYDLIPLELAHRLRDVANHPNLKYTVGDLRDTATIKNWYQTDADCLYHLASIVGVKHYMSDPLALIDIVVGGTRTLLEKANEHNTRVLFTSTSEVYGKNPNIPWAETDDRVLGPTSVDRWSYSTAKAVCEHMLFALNRSSGLRFTTVRFFNVYGPGQAPIFVISQSVHRALKGKAPYLYDDGSQTRCFTYVDDAIDGVCLAASSDEAVGQVINIGSNIENTMSEVVDSVIEATGIDLAPLHFQTEKEYGAVYEDIPKRVPDVLKAKEMLGWEISTTLHEGIFKTVDWARKSAWWLE